MARGFQEVGLKVVLLGVREFDRATDKVDKSIDEMNRSFDKTETSSKKASRGVDRYATSADKANRHVKRLAKENSSLAATFVNVGKKMTGLGTVLTAGVSLPLTYLQYNLFDMGVAFEDAFAGVGKTVEGISDDFGNLTEDGARFRKELIGLSLEIPITANELAAVAQAAGQVGVTFEDGGKTLLRFTEIAAGLGVATDIMAQDAAIALARVANIYGVTAENMLDFSEGFANSLVALGNTTAATEQEILNMTLRLAPAANLAGIAADETLALAASMTEMGIRAEAGGTALSRVIFTMAEASKTAGAGADVAADASKRMEEGMHKLRRMLEMGITDLTELKFALMGSGVVLDGVGSKLTELEKGLISVDDVMAHVGMVTTMDFADNLQKSQTELELFAQILGVTEEEFAAAFGADPLQTLQRFLSELADLQDAGKISSETLADLGFEGVRVRQVLNTLGPNMESVTENIELSNKAWIEQTALQVEVQKKFATTQAKIQIMKNAINALGVAMFDYLKPGFDALVLSLTNIVNGITKFISASRENAKLFFTIYTAVVAIGPALVIVGTALRTIGMASQFMGTSISIALGPVTLLIAAAAALYGAWRINLFGIKDKVKDFADNFVDEIDKIKDAVSEGNFSEIILSIGGFVDEVIRIIKNKFSGLLGLDPIELWAENSLAALGVGDAGDVEKALQSIISVLGPWAEIFKSQFRLLGAAFLEGDFEEVSQRLKNLSKTFSLFFDAIIGPAIDSFIKKSIPKIVGGLKNIAKAVLNWIVETAPEIARKLLNWGKEFIEWAEPHIPEIVKRAGRLIESIAKGLSEHAPVIAGALKDIISDAIGLISSADIEGGITKIVDVIGNMLKKIGFGDILLQYLHIRGYIEGWLSGVFAKIIGGIILFIVETDWGSFFQKLFSGDTFAALGELLATVAEEYSIGFFEGFKDGFGEENFDDVTGAVVDSLKNDEVKEAFNQAGIIVMDALWEGLKYVWHDKIVPGIQGLLISVVSSVTQSAANLIVDAIDVLKNAVPAARVVGGYIIRGLWDGIEDAWNTILTPEIRGVINALIASVKNVLGISSPSKVMFDIGRDIIQGLWDGIKVIWEQLKGYIRGIAENAIYTFEEKLDRFKKFGEDLVTNMWDGIKSLWEVFIMWVQSKAIAIRDTFRSILGAMKSFGTELVGRIQRGIADAWNFFISWVNVKANAIKYTFRSVLNAMRQFGRDIVDGIKQGILDNWDFFIQWAKDRWKEIPFSGIIELAVGSPSKVMADLGKNIVDGLQLGMEQNFPNALAVAQAAFGKLKTEAIVSTEGISQGMLGAALGSTISNTNTISNVSGDRIFSPTINGVPMQNEQSAGNEMMRAWRSAQVAGHA